MDGQNNESRDASRSGHAYANVDESQSYANTDGSFVRFISKVNSSLNNMPHTGVFHASFRLITKLDTR